MARQRLGFFFAEGRDLQYKFQDEHRRLYLYAALFLPFRSMVYMDRKSKKVSRLNLLMLYLKGIYLSESNYQVPVTSFIFRDSLKLKASDAEMVRILTPLTSYISSLVANFSVPQFFICVVR
ncbi:hypothetical protein BHE74_00031789 [Ensete ventricosum]|nr:hypothetical protein BHE74_00031789 [Ensete ventricosum]